MAKNENINLKLNMSVDDSLKSVRTMQLEIKALKEQEMEFETARNKAVLAGDTVAAKAHQNRINQIKEQRAGLMGAREDAASAEKMLDPGNLVAQFSKMSQGAVGAFGAVTGAMKAMGIESETVKKINENAAVVIQVMMGLEKVHALLIDGKSRAENAAAIKRGAIYVKDIAMKGADIAMTAGLTIATGAMTAAQFLLNVAMSANPIGLIVLAVVGLIAGFYALYKATGSLTEAFLWLVNPVGMLIKLFIDQAEEEKKLTAEKELSIQKTKESIKAVEAEIATGNKRSANLETYIDLLKKMGAPIEKVRAAEDEKSKQDISNTKKGVENAKLKLKLLEEQGQGELDNAEWITKLGDAKRAVMEAETEAKKTQTKQLQTQNERQIADLLKAQEKAKKDAEDRQKANEEWYKKSQESKKYYLKLLNDTTVSLMEEGREKELKILELAYIDRVNEAKKTIIDKKSLNKALKLLNDLNDKDKKTINDKFNDDDEKDVIEHNNWLREQEQLKFDNILVDEKNYSQLIIQMKKKAKFDEDNELIALEKDVADRRKEGQLITEQELIDAKKNITDKYVNIVDKSEKDILKNKEESDKAKIDAETEIQDKINSLKKEPKDIEKYYTDIANKEIAIEYDKWGKLAGNEEKFKEWEILKNQEKNDKIAEANRKQTEDQIKLVSDSISKINDLFNQASAQRISNIEQQYSTEEETLKNKLDRDLENTSLNDQQKESLQKTYDDKIENLEKVKNEKIKNEKEKAWKRQHAVDIAQAVANAAIAVAQVFAREPGELVIKTVAAGIAAGIAAGQVGLIASQKMPKFAKGGMIGGQSHAMGGTIIEAEAGEFIVNKRSMSNPGFASIINSINNVGNGAPRINSGIGQSKYNNSIIASVDNSAIAQAVIDAIQSIPVNVVESDITSKQKKVSTIENRSVIG